MITPSSVRNYVGSLLLAALFIAGAGHGRAATQTLTILGGNGAVGSIDPYAEASRDGGVTWQPAYLTGWHPWGFIEGTNSWINFDPSPFVGEYSTTLYRIRFSAPDSWTGSPVMNIKISADNYATVNFNGVEIGSIAGVGQLNANEIFAANLRPGVNTILLTLTDWGVYVGFNYRIDLSVEATESFVLGQTGDTDVDGLRDVVEIDIGTDPYNADSDGDGIKDGVEISQGMDPLVFNDADGDGVSDKIDRQNAVITGPIVLLGVDSGILNRVDGYGVDLGSQIAADVAVCQGTARNHGEFVSAVSNALSFYVKAGLITAAEKAVLESIAARSDVGKPATSKTKR